MELKGKKVNFLGDSITEGAVATDIEHAYWKVFGRNTGAEVRGYGIGGTRITPNRVPGPVPAYEQYFGSRVEAMDPDADIVVVLGGVNDCGHGDAPIGTMNDREENTFYGAFHCLCRRLIEKYPEATIVIMTPLHWVKEDDLLNDNGLRKCGMLRDYAEAERRVAEYYSLPVLDLYRVSGLNPALPIIREKYMPDGLHPNNAGHARIAARLQGFLESL